MRTFNIIHIRRLLMKIRSQSSAGGFGFPLTTKKKPERKPCLHGNTLLVDTFTTLDPSDGLKYY